MKNVGQILLIVGLVFSAFDSEAQNVKYGADAYKFCASCHGFKAEGNQLVNAPSLAGQTDWYLARQIRNFRDGLRGSPSDDEHGRNMAQMMKALRSDTHVADIVAYIGTLPAVKHARTMAGDVERGRAQYATCAACHGDKAQGNESLNAPALNSIEDWYQLAQLEKFKDGRRGAIDGDVYGMQMVPMAGILADEKSMQDVIAYIHSLQ